MPSFSSPAFTITVSGVSGAGKSSTVKAIAQGLGDAACFYFDDYGEAMQQPDDGLQWIGTYLNTYLYPRHARGLHRHQ